MHMQSANVLIVLVAASLSVGVSGDSYVFASDTRQWFQRIDGHAGTFSIGKLDNAGNFVVDARFVNLPEHSALSVAPPSKLLNVPQLSSERVYEYRSGRVIKGQLEAGGRFIPELGGTVISLESYLREYRPGETYRIYNLPGRILRKSANSD